MGSPFWSTQIKSAESSILFILGGFSTGTMKLFIFVAFLCVSHVLGAEIESLALQKVERSIDLASQFARHSVQIDVFNSGGKTVSTVSLALQEEQDKHLAVLDVFDESGAQLSVEKVGKQETTDKNSYVLYRVNLGKPLAAQASTKIQVKMVFTHVMTPFPAKISQNEKQLVRYYDNHYFFSPYTVQTQTTTVHLPSSHIEKKSELNPTSVRGETITYGPYEDVKPFSVSPMELHFENNKPFITITKMVKEIEVSHWGNIAVEMTVNMQHDGAKLKGVFSRYDYQRNPTGAPSVVPRFKQILPEGAADVYYRDEIGNISTSRLSNTERGITLDLIPRFPLFGGWKFGYYMGFNLPVSNYLYNDYNDRSKYVLNMTFAAQMDDVVIDELVVRVILPEGAKNIDVVTPFPIDGTSSDVHYTYLDTTGRPVLVLTKKNVVSELDRYFQVTYNFSKLSMLYEPLLLIVAFFIFFLFVMVYVRIEFHIGPKKREETVDSEEKKRQ